MPTAQRPAESRLSFLRRTALNSLLGALLGGLAGFVGPLGVALALQLTGMPMDGIRRIVTVMILLGFPLAVLCGTLIGAQVTGDTRGTPISRARRAAGLALGAMAGLVVFVVSGALLAAFYAAAGDLPGSDLWVRVVTAMVLVLLQSRAGAFVGSVVYGRVIGAEA